MIPEKREPKKLLDHPRGEGEHERGLKRATTLANGRPSKEGFV